MCVYGHAVGALRINKKSPNRRTRRRRAQGGRKEEAKVLGRTIPSPISSSSLSLPAKGRKKRKFLLYLVGLIAPSSSSFSFYSPHPTNRGPTSDATRVLQETTGAPLHRRVGKREGGWGHTDGVESVVVALYVLHPSLTHLVEAQSLTGRRSASTVFPPPL